jgi:carbon starvation protein
VLAAGPASSATSRLIFNNRLDAAVTGILIVMVTLVLVESVRQWWGILSGAREAGVKESPFVRTRLAEEQG